jgi:hypothetical protein
MKKLLGIIVSLFCINLYGFRQEDFRNKYSAYIHNSTKRLNDLFGNDDSKKVETILRVYPTIQAYYGDKFKYKEEKYRERIFSAFQFSTEERENCLKKMEVIQNSLKEYHKNDSVGIIQYLHEGMAPLMELNQIAQEHGLGIKVGLDDSVALANSCGPAYFFDEEIGEMSIFGNYHIYINQVNWEKREQDEKMAVLIHEMTHLKFQDRLWCSVLGCSITEKYKGFLKKWTIFDEWASEEFVKNTLPHLEAHKCQKALRKFRYFHEQRADLLPASQDRKLSEKYLKAFKKDQIEEVERKDDFHPSLQKRYEYMMLLNNLLRGEKALKKLQR